MLAIIKKIVLTNKPHAWKKSNHVCKTLLTLFIYRASHNDYSQDFEKCDSIKDPQL